MAEQHHLQAQFPQLQLTSLVELFVPSFCEQSLCRAFSQILSWWQMIKDLNTPRSRYPQRQKNNCDKWQLLAVTRSKAWPVLYERVLELRFKLIKAFFLNFIGSKVSEIIDLTISSLCRLRILLLYQFQSGVQLEEEKYSSAIGEQAKVWTMIWFDKLNNRKVNGYWID